MYVGQVIFGDQCRYLQVDFWFIVQWLFEVWLFVFVDGFYCLFEYFYVEGEVDCLDLFVLVVVE